MMKDEEFKSLISKKYPNAKTADQYLARLNKLKEVCYNQPIHSILSSPTQTHITPTFANIIPM